MIKKFIRRIILFCLFAAFIIEIFSAGLLVLKIPQQYLPGKEIYQSITKSKSKSPKRKVLIGDSVTRQLFPPDKDTYGFVSLAANQAISMVGQYILLKNYINAGNNPDTVYLIVTPFTFRNNLDQIYTYHYFLKPFNNRYNKEYFTDLALSQINKIPYARYSNLPHIKASTWAPEINEKYDSSFTFLSPVSGEYLNKIKELGNTCNFELIIQPTPTNIEWKDSIMNINKNEISMYGLDDEFCSYFNSITYFPDSIFIDGEHFKNPEEFMMRHSNCLNILLK